MTDNPNKVIIDDNETIESMIKKIDQLDDIGDKTAFCMTIYLHLTIKYGKSDDYEVWVARKWTEEGKKLFKPSLPSKQDNELMQRLNNQKHDIRLFMYLLHKKSKKLFNLFTEPIYQKIEKEERQERWFLWGIGLFVTLIIIYSLI